MRVTRKVEGSADDYGHPSVSWVEVHGALPVYFWSQRGSQARRNPGQEKIGEFKLMTYGTVDLRPLDRLEPLLGIVGFTFAEIIWAKGIMDVAGTTHHLEADVRSI